MYLSVLQPVYNYLKIHSTNDKWTVQKINLNKYFVIYQLKVA